MSRAIQTLGWGDGGRSHQEAKDGGWHLAAGDEQDSHRVLHPGVILTNETNTLNYI